MRLMYLEGIAKNATEILTAVGRIQGLPQDQRSTALADLECIIRKAADVVSGSASAMRYAAMAEEPRPCGQEAFERSMAITDRAHALDDEDRMAEETNDG